MISAMNFLFLSLVASSLSASSANAAECKSAQAFVATAEKASAESDRYFALFQNLMIRIKDQTDDNFNSAETFATAEKALQTSKAFNEVAAAALEKAEQVCNETQKK